MNTLDTYISEGLLNRKDSFQKTAEELLLDEIKKYSYDNFDKLRKMYSVWNICPEAISLKDGVLSVNPQKRYAFTVQLEFRDAPADLFSKFKIGYINDRVSTLRFCHINGLKNFEGVFTKPGLVGCDIIIDQCPDLVSLKGLPSTLDAELKIANNPKLKTYDGPKWIKSLLWRLNGEKLHSNDLSKYLSKRCPMAVELDSGLDRMLGYNITGNDIIQDYRYIK